MSAKQFPAGRGKRFLARFDVVLEFHSSALSPAGHFCVDFLSFLPLGTCAEAFIREPSQCSDKR